jgi:5'-3' exonuclease
MSVTKTVYLVDASIYIFRAWFSVPDTMRGVDGQPVNAVYGFTRFLAEFAERSQASHVAITFDESLTTSFRNEIYPQYKMNRELPPAELKMQFELCRKVAEAAGFYCVSHDRYEADDLIATLCVRMREQGYRAAIVSGDKDLTQLLQGQDFWWDFARNQQLDEAGVLEKFGVPPSAIQDYLGLCGDAVDNIPGVPGIGPKTAVALLAKYGSIEGVFDNLNSLATLPMRGAKTLRDKMQAYQEQALLSKQLATVSYTVPMKTSIDDLRRHQAEMGALQEISRTMGGLGEGLFARLAQSARDL